MPIASLLRISARIIRSVLLTSGMLNIRSALIALMPSGEVKWKSDVTHPIVATPVIGGGLIRATSAGDGQFLLVDRDGKKLAGRRVSSDAGLTSPAYSEGITYVVAGHQLFALDDSANVLWRFAVGPWMRDRSTAHPEGVLISALFSVYSLNRDGELMWKIDIDREVIGSLYRSGEGVTYFGTSDRILHALEPDGRTKWQISVIGKFSAAPIVQNDAVYYGTRNGTVAAVHRHSGDSIWTVRLQGKISGDLAIATEPALLFACTGSHLIALESSTGSIAWTYDAGVRTRSVVVGSAMVFLRAGGRLIAIDFDGAELWRFGDPGFIRAKALVASDPCVASDGTMFLGVISHQFG